MQKTTDLGLSAPSEFRPGSRPPLYGVRRIGRAGSSRPTGATIRSAQLAAALVAPSFSFPLLLWKRKEMEPPEDAALQAGKTIDNTGKCGRIVRLKAMTELSLQRRNEREGIVGALGGTGRRATPERSATSRAVHPRYRMQLRCPVYAGKSGWYRGAITFRPWSDRGETFFVLPRPPCGEPKRKTEVI